jgi:predicted permease
MIRATTVYGALLRCYPAAFRDEYGSQMLLAFADQLDEARRAGGRFQQAGVWIQAAVDLFVVAPREHGHVIAQDLRYALRTMAARPGFACVAVLSLALGIGANTAIFSLWHGVLRASLPAVRAPGQLVMLSNPDDSGSWTGRWNSRTDGPRSWLTYGEFQELQVHADAFSALMASQSWLNRWQVRIDRGAWEEVRGRCVSVEFFQVLGVSAFLGRVFSPADNPAAMPYAVVSYPYWQRRFGGRPEVLGSTVTVRNAALTIIGVTPPGFIGETSGQQPDLWVPLQMQPAVLPDRDLLHDSPPDKAMWLHVFGRLRPGVSAPHAEAQANAVFQAGLESFYGGVWTSERRRDYLSQYLRLQSGARGASTTRSEFAQSLTALLVAVGVLLLIACVNLANLLLARGAGRKPEIALRLSLGASRGRLIRQLVTESLLLAVLGGVTAVAVAYTLYGALVHMMAESDSRFHMDFVVNLLVLAFSVGATLLAGLAFGVFPAWQATKADAAVALKEQGRGAGGSLGRSRSGPWLVSLQLALSLPLLVGAGLLTRTAYNLTRADLGFPAERLLLVRVDLREAIKDAGRRDSVRREIFDRIQRVPGVRAASFSQLGIFSGGESSGTIEVEGYVPKGDRDREAARDVVGPGYFSTLGIPMIAGREISMTDHGHAAKLCVINEAFARQFFEKRNPLGMHVTWRGDRGERTAFEVVGVSGNARTQALRGAVAPRYFLSAAQESGASSSPTFLIRTAGESGSIAADVRKSIQDVAATVPILSAETIEEDLAPLTAQDRTTARLAMVFGLVALVLAAIGLYGVISYNVARRTGEIAVRIALGALPVRVVSMILRETAGIVVGGLIVGGGLAYVGSRLIESRLYGVPPQDPLTLAAATGTLLAVALGAVYVPARRASKLDPIAALRQE